MSMCCKHLEQAVQELWEALEGDHVFTPTSLTRMLI